MYVPGRMRSRSKDIVYARNWGVSATTGLLGLGLVVSEVSRIRDLPPDTLNFAYLAALGLTGVLIFLWIWATQHELDLLFDWLDPDRYTPPSSILETVLIVFMGLVLSAMFLSARDPLWYGLIFVTYSAIQIPAGRYTYAQITEAIERSKLRLASDRSDPAADEGLAIYQNGVAILEAYFVRRPLVARCVGILLGSLGGLCLAVAWKATGVKWLATASYLLYFVTIVGSEYLIASWRFTRDGRLRDVTSELAEYLRSKSAEREPN